MKGKKWLSLALAGMLAVSALAGCGSSSSSTGSADTDDRPECSRTDTGRADTDYRSECSRSDTEHAAAAAGRTDTGSTDAVNALISYYY